MSSRYLESISADCSGGIGGFARDRPGASGNRVRYRRNKADWTEYGVRHHSASNQLRHSRVGLADACVERGQRTRGGNLHDAGTFHAQVPNPCGLIQVAAINGIPRPILHDILTGEA